MTLKWKNPMKILMITKNKSNSSGTQQNKQNIHKQFYTPNTKIYIYKN